MNILIIEDHPLVRQGISSCLSDMQGYTIAGAATLDEAKRFITNVKKLPSLVILDIILGGENGLDFLSFFKTFCDERLLYMPPVLVCSVMEDSYSIRTALRLGAKGYVSKSANEAELLCAIETVLRNETYVSRDASRTILATMNVYDQFTRRELEVISLIKQHKTNTQIAKELYISTGTVENHISHIYNKTGLSTRQELLNL